MRKNSELGEQCREPERRSQADLKWTIFRRRPVTADVLLWRRSATRQQPTITELLESNDGEEILRQAPHRAGLAFCWPYFRLYLLNLVWAIPVIPFVDDWTWIGLVKVTGACAGVGFVMGVLASVIYQSTPKAGPIRGWMAIILAAPSCVLPILCEVQDGPEMLALAWRHHIITSWLFVIAAYTLAVACVGLLLHNRAEQSRAPKDGLRGFSKLKINRPPLVTAAVMRALD